MSDVLFNGSGSLSSGGSSGSSVELNDSNDEQAIIIQDASGSVDASVPEAQDESGSVIYNDSGAVNGLTTFNNNFVTLSFVIVILLSAIFGTLLFSLLKDFFK